MPVTDDAVLRRLARRLAIGLFLDVWPMWAAASLLVAGLVTLACRVFVPAASSPLAWLWLLAPALATAPALVICFRRFHSPAELVALADSLSGGSGAWLAAFETGDTAWRDSARAATTPAVPLPRLWPWRRLSVVCPAAAFMAAAFWIPQRVPQQIDGVLANEMAGRLDATLVELKQEQLVTDAEEERLRDEIERIRRSAERRVDAASWEAVDALQDRMAAGVAEKQNALQWAEQTVARQAAASTGAGAGAGEVTEATQAAELMKALDRLAQSGLLRGAPEDVQRLIEGGKLPTDAASLKALLSSLSQHVRDAKGRIAGLSQMGKPAGRFDPSEFPLAAADSARGAGGPGRGDATRGRADADLTWGKETAPHDRFRDRALPPGAPRSADDWAPVVEIPGAPDAAPVLTSPSAARRYEAVAGQSAWRRSLAPRHQSAVKKYFEQ
jgi:hypothetical protein